MLAEFGTLGAVLSACHRENLRVRRFDKRAVEFIGLVQATCLEALRPTVRSAPVLSSSTRLADYLRASIAFHETENLLVLFLDVKDRLIAEECLARGTVSAISVYPRQIILRAMELGASGLILAHNHPSDDSAPSKSDIHVTRCIAEAGRNLEISVRDHVIVSATEWTSMRGLGLL